MIIRCATDSLYYRYILFSFWLLLTFNCNEKFKQIYRLHLCNFVDLSHSENPLKSSDNIRDHGIALSSKKVIG